MYQFTKSIGRSLHLQNKTKKPTTNNKLWKASEVLAHLFLMLELTCWGSCKCRSIIR